MARSGWRGGRCGERRASGSTASWPTLGITPEIDAAGNSWATLKGASDRTVIIGSHLDSVPNGGWLDGALGVMVGLEALRMFKDQQPPVTIKVVDWADEEGARFGRSLLGSSAASGSLQVAEVEHLVDKTGVKLVDALRENGVELSRMHESQTVPEGDRRQGLPRAAHRAGAGARIDEQTDRRRARHLRRRAPPAALRRPGRAFGIDADPDAARCVPGRRGKRARVPRDRQASTRPPTARVVCTVGTVKVEPGIVTAVPGVCEISLDQRALDADGAGADARRGARGVVEGRRASNNVTVEWKRIWSIEPRPFDPKLIALCAEAVQEVTGDAPQLPSGPLHDAAEMVPHMPVVMMFAYSSNGLSHCKEEDTPEPHLLKTIEAFLLLVKKTVALLKEKGPTPRSQAFAICLIGASNRWRYST